MIVNDEIKYLGSSGDSKESTHLFTHNKELLKVHTFKSEGVLINPEAMCHSIVPWMLKNGYSEVRQSKDSFHVFEPVF